MAEESSSEKSEEPTSSKIRKSREEGQVAKSENVNRFVGLLVIFMSMIFLYHIYLGDYSKLYLAIFHAVGHQHNIPIHQIIRLIWQGLWLLVKTLIILIMLSSVMVFIVLLIQVNGFVLSKNFFKLKFDSFNPVQNFKNIFSKKNMIKFVKDMFAIIVNLVVAWISLKKGIKSLFLLPGYSFVNILRFVLIWLGTVLAWLMASYFILAIADLVLQRRSLHKELMMTKEELKQDGKENEGNPEVKQRRREIHEELNSESVNHAIANSSFVLSNPAHIAIVISYKPLELPLPLVVIKAKGYSAAIVLDIAKHHNVVIIRDKILARQLYDIGMYGKFVPPSLSDAVAHLIGKNLSILPQVKLDLDKLESITDLNI